MHIVNYVVQHDTTKKYEIKFFSACRCQTYEGGFSAVPGSEAHGGYSFCGFASSLLLDNEQKCDTQKLLVSST